MPYLTPGVYIEEVSTGPKPIAAGSTSTCAFIGVGPNNAHLDEPWACNSWSDFVREFMDEKSEGNDLAHAIYGYFTNGGSRCYVLNIGPNGSISGDARKRNGIRKFEEYDEPTMFAIPGFSGVADYNAVLDHCEKMGGRIALLDGPATFTDAKALTEVASVDTVSESGKDEDAAKPRRSAKPETGLRPRKSDTGHGAVYTPHIIMRSPITGANVTVPPCGHIAGIYARTDATRGVHKAPANEIVRAALGLSQRITAEEQGVLNPAGVNCLRFFQDSGVRVWGARTLAGQGEWQYINVRRLFNMLEEAIQRGTQWVVFAPNDNTTRMSVCRDITAFLKLQWRAGALVGNTPQEAFFVKCDAELNPPEVVDSGRLIVEIGVAPSKPAEFVVFRIGQWDGGSSMEVAA